MSESSVRGDLKWRSIPNLVQSAAERFPERECVVDGAVRLTFGELSEAVDHAARALIGCGVELGDRVAIWAPNIWEWVVSGLGALAAGGVLVPMNTRFKGPEAAFSLNKSGAKTLLTVTDFLGTDYVGLLRAPEAGAPLRQLDNVVVLRGPATEGATPWTALLEAGASVDPAEARHRSASLVEADVSDIIFTSGTTGHPKGAMLTHGQSLRVFADWASIVGLRRGDRYLIVNPFFHTFGYKAGILACLMQGATIVPMTAFDVETVLACIEAERISVLPGPPTIYQSILNHPGRDEHDLSSLRLAVTGAAAVPVELIKRMRTELSFETVITAYGLTESTGTVSICRPGDDPETISHTSGRAIPGTEVKVVDDEGLDAARGDPGEILVRGYNVMVGYLDDPEGTSRVIDGEGWLRTGDIGTMDGSGYLTITDRKKDMFIVGGFNAYPAEIENLLLGHDKIAQVAVVGIPDDRLGEVGVAFIVPRPGKALSGEEVLDWARERMANFKVPRRVEVVESLPLSASGKVLKYQLRRSAHRPGETTWAGSSPQGSADDGHVH